MPISVIAARCPAGDPLPARRNPDPGTMRRVPIPGSCQVCDLDSDGARLPMAVNLDNKSTDRKRLVSRG